MIIWHDFILNTNCLTFTLHDRLLSLESTVDSVFLEKKNTGRNITGQIWFEDSFLSIYVIPLQNTIIL